MGRGGTFRDSINQYLGGKTEERKPLETHPTDFDLPPEQSAYYQGQAEGAEHREKLKSIKGTAARNNYIKGIREGLTQDDRPKRGDIDNPLKKDQPKESRQPRRGRQPRPGAEIRHAQANMRKFSSLARTARGRRR